VEYRFGRSRPPFRSNTAVAVVAASAAILTLPLYMIRPSARHWPLRQQLATGVVLWLSWHVLVVVFVRSVKLRSALQGAPFGMGTAAMMLPDVFYPNVLDPLIRWVGRQTICSRRTHPGANRLNVGRPPAT
jgi:hypothetical protein